MEEIQMKRFISAFSAVFTILIASVSIAADFSADMIISTGGEEDAKGKIYMQGNRMRMEMDGDGDENAVTISRPDKKVVWILMPEEKMYMEQPYPEDPKMKEWTSSMEEQSKFIGNETVSGLTCKKYQAQDKETYYWISEKLNFPVKTQDPDGSMLLKNIKIGNVPGSLFELPKGYEKFSMPAIPGGMPQGFPGMPKGR
ncbi:MAG: hypothetical protein CVU64_14305 [Deltaproteobacteria bacterium HGW-Deltaproteobacteria-21]|jgi:hypothetical protein|nr:MAG: hypothetical protein CVU64_14305 [Deltaproteobacteria bacterium HGW-Deltaproteobacteria-21]